MAKTFLVNIDMNGNQILNFLVQNLASDPGSPAAGQIWMNTTSDKLKYYDGTSVITIYDASSTNTASKLVLRDSSGDFAANIITAATVTGLNAPSAGSDATNKTYVDALVNGLDWKKSARVASTANVDTSSAPASIDGITLASGDRILLKDQSTGSQNGVWTFAAESSALTRATDADVDVEITAGFAIFIEEGTTNADTGWVLTTDNVITVGTTALTFAQFTGGSVTAGDGMTQSGNTLNVVTASSSRIVVNANNIDLATTGVSAADYTKVTVDVYGRVTAGADIISSNGIVVKTASSTFTNRSVAAGTGISVTNGDGVSGNPTVAIDTAVTSRKYATDIGDGSAVAYTVTHNLGSRDVLLALRDNTSPYAYMEPDFEATTTNTVTVRFAIAPTTNQYRVIVQG